MVNVASVLRTVPLKDVHKNLGARMVPFSGWEMPVQYEGIISEHQCVRNTAGLFDVSHMGRWEIRGRDAVAFVNYISINNVAILEDLGRRLDHIVFLRIFWEASHRHYVSLRLRDLPPLTVVLCVLCPH